MSIRAAREEERESERFRVEGSRSDEDNTDCDRQSGDLFTEEGCDKVNPIPGRTTSVNERDERDGEMREEKKGGNHSVSFAHSVRSSFTGSAKGLIPSASMNSQSERAIKITHKRASSKINQIMWALNPPYESARVAIRRRRIDIPVSLRRTIISAITFRDMKAL